VTKEEKKTKRVCEVNQVHSEIGGVSTTKKKNISLKSQYNLGIISTITKIRERHLSFYFYFDYFIYS